MPWTSRDATKHTKKAGTAHLRKLWADTANATRSSCMQDSGNVSRCDALAIRTANEAVDKEIAEMGGPMGGPMELAEATKRVGGRDHDKGDFLVATTDNVTDWHLPVKINGKPDRRLAGAAWAALFSPAGYRGQRYEGPDKAGAKRRLKALYKAQDWETPVGEADVGDIGMSLSEFYGYEPEVFANATTFADLDAQSEALKRIEALQERMDQLHGLVRNVLWTDDEPQAKIASLRELFAEFVTIVETTLSPAAPVEVEEQADVLALSELEPADWAGLIEAEAQPNPRRLPVAVEFSIIKPGWGNSRDNRYYRPEVLERDGHLFEGADIFATNHNDTEKSERTKVGRFRKVKGLTEDGLIGQAVIYDPDMAEKVRNRADAGQLDTLHCSIYAAGTGYKGDIDGRRGSIVERIDQVGSVDLVAKAGAGGHALALSEQETVMEEPIVNEAELEEGAAITEPIVIQEQDQAPVEAAPVEPAAPRAEQPAVVEQEPGPAAAEAQPATLSADAVTHVLAEYELGPKAQAIILSGAYADEAGVRTAVEALRSAAAELNKNAGKPFALGESAAPQQPVALSGEALEKRKADRFATIMSELDPHFAQNYVR